jgi:phage shock protein A
MKSTERNLDDIKYKIDAAAEKGDKELLIELLVQEDEYTQQYQDRKEVFDKAVAEALKIRDQYKQFESEMNARLRELQSIKSQVKLAEMKQSINNLGEKYGFDGKNSDDLNGRMERLREIVTVKTARANAVESLKSEGVEEKIKQLDREIIFKRAEQKADMLLNKHNTETKNVNEATNEGT